MSIFLPPPLSSLARDDPSPVNPSTCADDFTSANASFESILSRLSSYFFVESDDALLRWIRKTLRLKGLREKMKAWRTEWQGFVRDGTSEGRLS